MTSPQPSSRPGGASGALLFILSMALVPGCGHGKDGASSVVPTAPTTVATTTQPAPAPSPAPTPSPAPVPTPAPSPPAGNVCAVVSGVLGQSVQGIINGADCSPATSPVVMINLFDNRGRDDGSCTGTVIAPRAVLTAAHCLSGVGSVTIDLAGQQMRASSFEAIPSYRERDANSPDVGVIIMSEAIPRAPVPLLLSREAQTGDAGIIAGYGEDERGAYGTLKAGPITIAEVNSRFLVAQYTGVGSNTCYGDSGGPLLLSASGGYAIAGVTSGGDDNCNRGMSDFAKISNGEISSFILGLVPDAARR